MLQTARHIIMRIMSILNGINWRKKNKSEDTSSTNQTEIESKKEFKMNKDLLTICICLTILGCSAITGSYLYFSNDRNNMSHNIEVAIQKGVDPVAVKCAYEVDNDATCVTYAAMTALTERQSRPLPTISVAPKK